MHASLLLQIITVIVDCSNKCLPTYVDINNNKNNNTLMFMVLSSRPRSLREFTRFIWWMQTERQPSDQAKWHYCWH